MPGEVPSDVPPAAFGRFRVLHQIGVGSLGPVFRAVDPDTRAAVVIKLLRLDVARDTADEVRNGLRALVERIPGHPGVLRVLDVGLHEQRDPFVVSPFATGESLDVALREYGPAAIADALPRLKRLADALDRSAAQGVWHGSLQPRDILVTGDETQMTGLGIVPVLEHAGVRRPARRPYAAPEVVDGASTTPASDQYALGAIAYEWLFGGRAPRSAESVLDAPALQGVNAEALAGALMTALAAKPADRFASCTEFVDDMAAAVKHGDDGADVRDDRVSSPATAVLVLDVAEDTGEEDGEGEALFPAEDDERPETKEPAVLAVNDLRLEPVPPPVPETTPMERQAAMPRQKTEPIAWQGTLGATSDPGLRPPRVGFTAGALVGALLAGMVLGGVGGYLLGTSGWARRAAPIPTVTDDQPAPEDKPTTPGRDFTEAPVAGGSSPVPDDARAVDATPAASSETALLVRSSPAGAMVTVDGTSRGTTPLTLRDLALGTRMVVLHRPGYVPVERSITLTADRPARSVEVQLTAVARPTRAARGSRPTPTAATLIVESRPTGSTVTIDGKASGTTPLTVDSIAPGTYTVRIERAGYRPVTQTIAIRAGERRRVAASLESGPDE